jgi:uncharacterized protein (DUF2235 family)
MSGNNKKLIVFCDGTWNKPDETDHDGKSCPTNVSKLFRATCSADEDGIPQITHYIKGIGIRKDEKLRGGGFGMGISKNIIDSYQFICSNYVPGDQIFLFGFSRGAYTARSLAGLIYNMGILKRQYFNQINKAYEKYRDRSDAWHPSREKDNAAKEFRDAYTHGEERIHFLGVWDTVGALGAPYGMFMGWLIDKIFKCRFHNAKLTPIIENGYHALAKDEKRWPFRPTLWELTDGHDPAHFEQKWFDGVHCDVGGGYPDSELSDVALEWMAEKAIEHGLNVELSTLTPPPVFLKDKALENPLEYYMHDSQTPYYRGATNLLVKWPATVFVDWPGKVFKSWPDTYYQALNRYGVIVEPDIAQRIANLDYRGNYHRPWQ